MCLILFLISNPITLDGGDGGNNKEKIKENGKIVIALKYQSNNVNIIICDVV